MFYTSDSIFAPFTRLKRAFWDARLCVPTAGPLVEITLRTIPKFLLLLGLRREFSPFVNQLGEMAYGLTIYIDQSIYESTSPYMNTGTLGDVIG